MEDTVDYLYPYIHDAIFWDGQAGGLYDGFEAHSRTLDLFLCSPDWLRKAAIEEGEINFPLLYARLAITVLNFDPAVLLCTALFANRLGPANEMVRREFMYPPIRVKENRLQYLNCARPTSAPTAEIGAFVRRACSPSICRSSIELGTCGSLATWRLGVVNLHGLCSLL